MAFKQTNLEVWNSLALDLVSIQVQGKIVFVNAAGAKMLGAATAEQLVGRPIVEFVHPDYRDVAVERVQAGTTLESVVCPSQETWLRLDGTAIAVKVVAMPVVFEDQPAVQLMVRKIEWGRPDGIVRNWRLPSRSRRRPHSLSAKR